jgi:signal transduction histidine kinase
VLSEVGALADVIAESLGSNAPVMRRTVAMDTPRGAMHLGVSVSPLAADAGPSGAICLFTDLTGVVALEEQLRLKEALARLGELTAGLAHEFRNGLATIHGYGRLLDPSALPEQYRPYVEGIRSEAQALGEVVTNFLKFARPEPLTLVPVDLRTLVERAAEDAPQARIELRGDFGMVEADDVLLRQAMSNLFRNSVEACAVEGITSAIVVEATRDPAASVIHLEVRDNGPGIRPDALAQVFQPFFTTRPGGTGLGLAIVQKVVVSHNGRISAGNRMEGGAVFKLTLPVRVHSSSAET